VFGVVSLLFFPLGLVGVVLGIIATAKKQNLGVLSLVIAAAGLIGGIAIGVALVT
jgi:hypothetical protein